MVADGCPWLLPDEHGQKPQAQRQRLVVLLAGTAGSVRRRSWTCAQPTELESIAHPAMRHPSITAVLLLFTDCLRTVTSMVTGRFYTGSRRTHCLAAVADGRLHQEQERSKGDDDGDDLYRVRARC